MQYLGHHLKWNEGYSFYEQEFLENKFVLILNLSKSLDYSWYVIMYSDILQIRYLRHYVIIILHIE